MANSENHRAKVIARLRRITLVELLLAALLVSSVVNGNRMVDLDASLRRVDDSLVDVQNEVRSQTEEVQTKLDELKDELEQVAANQ